MTIGQMFKLLNLKTALILTLALVVLLGATQLVLANEMSSEGQKIRELEEQKFGLENEIRTLDKEVAGLGSLNRVQKEAEALGLLYKPEIFEYLSPPKLAQAQ